jgi:hypothetical protein
MTLPGDKISAPIIGIGLVTFGVAIVSLIRPDDSEFLVRIWLIAITAILLFSTVGLLGRVLPVYHSPRQSFQLRRGIALSNRPDRAVQIERMVTSGKWSQREFRARLRPVLLTIAQQRLLTYRGIDARAHPEAAAEVLGDRIWTILVTPIHGSDDDGPGFSMQAMDQMVTALEDIGGNTSAIR